MYVLKRVVIKYNIQIKGDDFMNIKPIKLKSLLIFVGATLAAGGIGTLLGGSAGESYKQLIKPPLSPPAIVFPIVWTLLYTLIGIGAYIISEEDSKLVPTALKLYWTQLVANILWPLFFWRFELLGVAAALIVVMIVLTILLMIVSSKINFTAVLFFLPYLIWLVFALYLNVGLIVLN